MHLKTLHLVSQVFKKIDLIMKLWIARDENGTLALHESEPRCPFSTWHNSNQVFYLDNDLFPEVTYDNSPQQVEIKLI